MVYVIIATLLLLLLSTIIKYKFILGARVKNEGSVIAEIIEGPEWANGDMVEYLKPDGSRLIIEYTDSRAKKDEFNRTRGIRKLEK